MTESEIFESITGGGITDFAALVGFLNRQARWCLIGGLAVNCYVEPVYTLDADIVVIASELRAVKDALIEAGFTCEEFPSLNARMAGSDLRIQFSIDPRYQDFLDTRRFMPFSINRFRLRPWKMWCGGKSGPGAIPKRRLSKHKKDELDLIRILETYPHLAHLMPAEIRQQLERE